MPDSSSFNGLGGNYSDPLTSGRTRTQGWLLSDTLGVLDDKLLFTAGARHQKVVIRGYNKITGQENKADGFDGSRWMPTYGVVYKPWEAISCMLTTLKRCSRVRQPPTPPPTTGRAPASFTLSRTKWA